MKYYHILDSLFSPLYSHEKCVMLKKTDLPKVRMCSSFMALRIWLKDGCDEGHDNQVG